MEHVAKRFWLCPVLMRMSFVYALNDRTDYAYADDDPYEIA